MIDRREVTDDALDAPDGAEVHGMERVGEQWWRVARLHWIIPGGESGPGARPCNIDWIRSLVEQGYQAGARVFVKQLGARPYEDGPAHAARIPIPVECVHGYDVCPECDAADVMLELTDRKGGDPDEWPEDLRVREFPETAGGAA